MAKKFQREYLIFEEIIKWDDHYVVEVYSIKEGKKTKDVTISKSHNNTLEKTVEAIRREGFGNKEEEDIVVTTIPTSRIGKITRHPLNQIDLHLFYDKLVE